MKKLVSFFFFLLFIICLHAQQLEFSHLDNTNGLSNNQVESLYRDSRGFMWFGTNMGLNRYDGINFKIYKHIKNDPLSPAYNKIIDIQEDILGNLWLKSSAYFIYNWQTESFCNHVDSVLAEMGLPASPSHIEIDEKKNFYAAYSGKGVYCYNVSTGKVMLFDRPSGLNISDFVVSDLKVNGNNMWTLFANGVLACFDLQSGKTISTDTYFRDNSKNSTIQKSVFIDADNDIWIYPGVDDRGVACYDVPSKEWTLYNTETNIALSSSFIRSLGQDAKGTIWIGTDHGGVNLYDKKSKRITVLKNNIYNKNSISQNSIISIYCENNGTVWIGTYKNGLSYYNPNMFKFDKSPLFYVFNKNADTFDCNSLYKDTEGNLWIGTNGRGLVKYNEQTNAMQNYRNDANDPKSISADIITSIYQDHANTMWIGTFLGGLNAYDGHGFKHYQLEEHNLNSLSSKSVYGLAEDNENNLWIATLGGGVNKLSADRKMFTHYNLKNSKIVSDYVLSIFIDPVKNIFFSTDQGLNYVDNIQKNIEPYFKDSYLIDSLTTIAINYQIVDSRGLIWIATDRGINIYDPHKKDFTYITVLNGLPSDEVVSLVEDNDGNVWAGTRNGLACIYCRYTDQLLSPTVVYFNENDGLPGAVCNQNAVFKDHTGIIYIGTTNGYVSFNPKEIVYNKQVPQPRFTDLLITDQVIRPQIEYNGRIILEKTITDLEEIKLNYGETNFTVLFSALNYIHSEKNQYKYKLEGLDNKWTLITSGVGAASYSNLNPGTYKLIVYASNDDNVWSSDPIVLKIEVRPPFWLSWWAYIIYILVIAALIRFFLKYKLNKQKGEYEQAQKILEADKQHEVDELKFKFFTNISHEFKTPLTLILTPLEKMMKSPASAEQQAIMTIMHKNAQNLLSMVNEILDFRKFDLNKMTLNVSRGNIVEFTKDICFSFSSLAVEKSIKLTFTSYLQELQMEFDREKMTNIITNLISNAFKYTEDGHIDVSLGIMETLQGTTTSLSVKQLSLKISDTGIGIEEEYLQRIFERFYRVENPEKNYQSGTGVGLHLVSEYVKMHGGEILVESTVGKGSVFTVLLPIHKSFYQELKSQDIIHSGDTYTIDNLQVKTESKPAQRNNLPVLLVVDDNEDFREFLTALFQQDYRIVTASDGEEASVVVLDQVPDIILCDVMMPKMDGYEFCRKIKGDIRTSHIPIILLTAKSSEENKYSGIEAGADDYISKPFNIDMLKLKIAKIIEKQRLFQNNFKKKIAVSPSEIEITPMDEKFVQKAISIVEANIGNPDFLVEDLCKEMGMSRVYFYKKTLALTDKTPSEFIRLIRLKRAADLLEKSQLFVNEIAFQVGFNDPKYFRKYFKEEFGMTPNEYKKNVSN